MSTKKLGEIRDLRNAANTLASFFAKWREKYLSDSNCDKKAARFVGADERFAAFSFKLTFDAHAGYYGNSGCHTIFSIPSDMARTYFTKAIEEQKVALFQRASELMLADAAKMSVEAQTEIDALQAMLDALPGIETTAQAEQPA